MPNIKTVVVKIEVLIQALLSLSEQELMFPQASNPCSVASHFPRQESFLFAHRPHTSIKVLTWVVSRCWHLFVGYRLTCLGIFITHLSVYVARPSRVLRHQLPPFLQNIARSSRVLRHQLTCGTSRVRVVFVSILFNSFLRLIIFLFI